MAKFILFLTLCSFMIAMKIHESEWVSQESYTQNTKRKALLEELRNILPESEEWEQWLEESGELPPDFDAMESIPFLPDPLRMQNGHIVESTEEWSTRRDEIFQLFQHYIIGEYPEAPENIRVREKNSTLSESAVVHDIILEFGPDYQATLSFELLLPKSEGPFPVFLTQDNHRRWALIAVSRGYAGVVYAGADSKDDTEEWRRIYPEFDWTRLTRRAWAAGRVIDYLETLDYIDHDKIALTGHSRNGKLSIIGGAIDNRIDAVISSSSGAGGSQSFRFYSDSEFGESLELLTRTFPTWMHPRLRFFTGREDKLPVDMPNLIPTIAPRPFLFTSAYNDRVESIWDMEHNYRSAESVYKLFDAQDNIGLLYRPGTHEIRAQDIELYIDWLDYQFGRGTNNPSNDPVYPVYDDWRENTQVRMAPGNNPANDLDDILKLPDGSRVSSGNDWQIKLQDIRNRIQSGLGKAPSEAISYPGRYGSERRPHIREMLNRADLPEGISKLALNFGNYINADLYFPETALKNDSTIPVIIWVHPISNPHGYRAGYMRGTQPYLSLAKQGYAVFAFDQIGHGGRLLEAQWFYDRYPDWTLLGRTVHDIKQAVNALMLEPLTEYDEFGATDFIDRQQIYVLGYAMGGRAALHAAALDERIAGAVSIAGFTPMRSDTPDKPTGGLARWSKHYPLQPWLADFIGYEEHVPYDYHEILAAIAPRKVGVIAPRIDSQSSLKDVETSVDEAMKVFNLLNAENKIRFATPPDYNHFGTEMQEVFLEEFHLLLKAE